VFTGKRWATNSLKKENEVWKGIIVDYMFLVTAFLYANCCKEKFDIDVDDDFICC
jgi:hypothetical protein